MNYLSTSITARITEQVKNQLPQILLKEVSNFAPSVIQSMLKKFLIDKMDKSESYLAAPEHRECYDGLIKSRVKEEKTSKDAKLTKGTIAKESQSGSSKGTKSQPKSSGKSIQSEEPEFKAADSNMPQDQEGNLGNDDDEPMKETVSKRDWFTKPTQPREPTDPDWNLEYDFEECYKALSEKLDWENPEGNNYPFDLTKPLPLALKTWFQIYGFLLKLPMINMRYGEYHIGENNVEVMRKHGYGYMKEIVVRRKPDKDPLRFKEGQLSTLLINDQPTGTCPPCCSDVLQISWEMMFSTSQ
ncbi:hypothetical protein Tco_0139568 [Tanacetum coccineum]